MAFKGLCDETSVEAKAGYFFFSDSKMRKIYDKGGLDVQLSGSCPIWKWIQIYGSVEYFKRHGHSLNAHQRTSIWGIPLSLGLKPVIKICPQVRYYFTLGPRYFFVYQHNQSFQVDKHAHSSGLGGFVNMGFNFFPIRNLFLDIFGEYSYKRMHFHSSKSNVYSNAFQIGGFTFGGGIGYAF